MTDFFLILHKCSTRYFVRIAVFLPFLVIKNGIFTKLMVLFISQNNYRKRGFVLEVKLYEYIEKKKLEKLLECLYSCLELPLQALNENGQTLCGFGISTPFCDCFKKLLSVYSTPKDSCRELHADAALRALKSQKPYIFSCHANLNHLVYPLYHDSEALGCILIGPFLTAPADTDMLSDIGERYGFLQNLCWSFVSTPPAFLWFRRKRQNRSAGFCPICFLRCSRQSQIPAPSAPHPAHPVPKSRVPPEKAVITATNRN